MENKKYMLDVKVGTEGLLEPALEKFVIEKTNEIADKLEVYGYESNGVEFGSICLAQNSEESLDTATIRISTTQIK